jgi:uncharacterized membrane protein YadS
LNKQKENRQIPLFISLVLLLIGILSFASKYGSIKIILEFFFAYLIIVFSALGIYLSLKKLKKNQKRLSGKEVMQNAK